MPEPQAVSLSLTNAATEAARDLLADLSSLVRATGFRRSEGVLSCIAGIGAGAWGRLFPGPRPRELEAFAPIQGVHTAPYDAGRSSFPYPRHADGYVFRTGNPHP
ncbi:MAG: Dyp-type peroxidase domain-containing protein [Paracoccus sp. (in: a-proteobacteria)]